MANPPTECEDNQSVADSLGSDAGSCYLSDDDCKPQENQISTVSDKKGGREAPSAAATRTRSMFLAKNLSNLTSSGVDLSDDEEEKKEDDYNVAHDDDEEAAVSASNAGDAGSKNSVASAMLTRSGETRSCDTKADGSGNLTYSCSDISSLEEKAEIASDTDDTICGVSRHSSLFSRGDEETFNSIANGNESLFEFKDVEIQKEQATSKISLEDSKGVATVVSSTIRNDGPFLQTKKIPRLSLSSQACLAVLFLVIIGALGFGSYLVFNEDFLNIEKSHDDTVDLVPEPGHPDGLPPKDDIFGEGIMSPSPTAGPSESVAVTSSPTVYPTSQPSARPVTNPTAPPSSLATPVERPENIVLTLVEFMITNFNFTFPEESEDPVYRALQWLSTEATTTNYTRFDEDPQKFLQRFALTTIDFSFPSFANGASTNHIATLDQDECSWPGVTCVNDTVTELAMGNMSLTGSIPSELALLTSLTSLDLSQNNIHGSIPEALWELQNLKKLYLYHNRLTGNISDSIGYLPDLTHLHLSHNNLTGTIPLTMLSGNISKPYYYINLYSNQLTGTIPQSLRWRQIFYLDLGKNKMTGSLPSDLGRLIQLRHLHLDHNEFTGQIPDDFLTIGSGTLQTVSLENNNFTSFLSSYFVTDSTLVSLTIENNPLEDKINKNNCKQSIFDSGMLVEFKADCDFCECTPFCDHCWRNEARLI